MKSAIYSNKKFVVLSGGIQRSGSTWLFNAIRLLASRATEDIHAVWCKNFDVHSNSKVQIIKAHTCQQAEHFIPDKVVATDRDIAESIVSLIRMGWIVNSKDAIIESAKRQVQLRDYWASKADMVFDYEEILRKPHESLLSLSNILDCSISGEEANDIAQVLNNLKIPQHDGYDSVTLLHPRHRSYGEYSDLYEGVREIVVSYEYLEKS